MIPLALTVTPAARAEVLVLVGTFLWIFGVASFLVVGTYILRQFRAGRLLNGVNAPPPFAVSGLSGGFFLVCVIELIFLQSILYVIMVVMGIAGLLVESRRTAVEQFGLARLPLSRLAAWSLLVFGAVMLVETPLTQGIWLLFDMIHLPHPEQQSVESFRHYDRPSVILGFLLQAVVIFPVIEELFFRGFLLTFLKKYTATWAALILSAGVFAFAHVNLGAVIPLWFLGIVLGIAYEHTGSLLLPVGIHACWNLATALTLLLNRGNS